jgi:hypothetical protein
MSLEIFGDQNRGRTRPERYGLPGGSGDGAIHIGSVLVSEARGPASFLNDRDFSVAVPDGDFDPKTTALGER